MTDWNEYYEKTKDAPPNPVLAQACKQVDATLPKIAIDCGCGSGRGIAFLLAQGFDVHAFDADPGAEAFCKERFAGEPNVRVTTATFASFSYPQAALLTAIYSLFFCPAGEWDTAWQKITAAIMPGGIFCGTFLGPNDSWAAQGHVADRPDLKIITHAEADVRSLLDGFTMLALDVNDEDGHTAEGVEKHWHSIMAVARRN